MAHDQYLAQRIDSTSSSRVKERRSQREKRTEGRRDKDEEETRGKRTERLRERNERWMLDSRQTSLLPVCFDGGSERTATSRSYQKDGSLFSISPTRTMTIETIQPYQL